MCEKYRNTTVFAAARVNGGKSVLATEEAETSLFEKVVHSVVELKREKRLAVLGGRRGIRAVRMQQY